MSSKIYAGSLALTAGLLFSACSNDSPRPEVSPELHQTATTQTANIFEINTNVELSTTTTEHTITGLPETTVSPVNTVAAETTPTLIDASSVFLADQFFLSENMYGSMPNGCKDERSVRVIVTDEFGQPVSAQISWDSVTMLAKDEPKPVGYELYDYYKFGPDGSLIYPPNSTYSDFHYIGFDRQILNIGYPEITDFCANSLAGREVAFEIYAKQALQNGDITGMSVVLGSAGSGNIHPSPDATSHIEMPVACSQNPAGSGGDIVFLEATLDGSPVQITSMAAWGNSASGKHSQTIGFGTDRFPEDPNDTTIHNLWGGSTYIASIKVAGLSESIEISPIGVNKCEQTRVKLNIVRIDGKIECIGLVNKPDWGEDYHYAEKCSPDILL